MKKINNSCLMKKFIIVAVMLLCACQHVEAKPRRIRNIQFTDAGAFTTSIFVPGLGQMIKGRYGAGATFLLTEAALISGTCWCYMDNREQLEILKDPNITAEDFTNANNRYRATRIAFYTGLSTTLCVHIINIITAYTMRSESRWALAPAVYNISNDNLAMGVSFAWKF